MVFSKLLILTFLLSLSNLIYAKDKVVSLSNKEKLVSNQESNKGYQIALKADQSQVGFITETSNMTLILINNKGDKVERKMVSQIFEKKGGDKSIIKFDWPADVKGTKMLTWSHSDRNDDQWLYLPALKRVKRISSNRRSGSFMGSEFSYEDLGSQEVNKYTYKFIKEDSVNNRSVDVIQRVSVEKDSGYSKENVYIDKEYQSPVKVEYFDRKGELLKISEFKGYNKISGFWRWNEIEVKNVQTLKSSVLLAKNRVLKKTMSEGLFNKAKLQ